MKSPSENILMNDCETTDLVPAGRLGLDGALAVYRDAYRARLLEVLGETYEAVWKILGDEDFFRVAEGFIESTPSTSWNLSDYSEHFPAYLREHTAAADFLFLPDVARVCWMRRLCFDSKEEVGLDADSFLAKVQKDDGRIFFVSHFFVCESEHSLAKIWDAVQENVEIDESIDAPEGMAIFIVQHQVYTYGLTAAQARTLALLKEGHTLENACGDISEQEVTTLFEFLAKRRLISSR